METETQDPVTDTLPSFDNEAVQDLFEQRPAWLVRWGTTLLCGIVGALLLLGFFVYYPDLVRAPFRLTSSNAPKPVLAKTEGRLVALLVADNAQVRRGQPLAYLESTTDAPEALRLYAWLLSLRQQLEAADGSLPANVPDLPPLASGTQLGTLQADYAAFLQARAAYHDFQANGFYQRQRGILQQELQELQRSAQNLQEQRGLYQRDLELARKQYALNQDLYRQKVIPQAELRREESQLLAKELPLKQAEYAQQLNTSAQFQKNKELLELARQNAAEGRDFRQALNQLISRIETWQATYVLTATADGQLRFGSFLQEGQPIRLGQEVFYLAGSAQDEYGEVRLPQQNLGKVRVGQRVLIRFDSYPSAEFGVVNGRVSFISDVPHADGTFLAKVTLTEGLRTSYGKELSYRPGMTANAEIITSNSRLLMKLFARLKEGLSR
ncbi:HlyD family efflux transporter periplasmic adaptor subunit [Hymenobacter coalescens]